MLCHSSKYCLYLPHSPIHHTMDMFAIFVFVIITGNIVAKE